ncbi:hypothetical protein H920_12141 [Fukomys damarensis]|uniref:Uncharacterized protein n=1 Tax=Fukomys damarensis TaxID=885580 RepID=A0A091D864_FUKDA|nr:hypothetical protein H920_12141 [Fukomys damarensis]
MVLTTELGLVKVMIEGVMMAAAVVMRTAGGLKVMLPDSYRELRLTVLKELTKGPSRSWQIDLQQVADSGAWQVEGYAAAVDYTALGSGQHIELLDPLRTAVVIVSVFLNIELKKLNQAKANGIC